MAAVEEQEEEEAETAKVKMGTRMWHTLLLWYTLLRWNRNTIQLQLHRIMLRSRTLVCAYTLLTETMSVGVRRQLECCRMLLRGGGLSVPLCPSLSLSLPRSLPVSGGRGRGAS